MSDTPHSLVAQYLSDDDIAAIKHNRGRQLAEQLAGLLLIVPTSPEENEAKAKQQAILVQQLKALE